MKVYPKNDKNVHESCIFPVEFCCGHMEFRILIGGTTLKKYLRVVCLEKEPCLRCKNYIANAYRYM